MVCCTSARGNPTIAIEVGVRVAAMRYEPSDPPRSIVSGGFVLTALTSEASWALSSSLTTPSVLIHAPDVASVA